MFGKISVFVWKNFRFCLSLSSHKRRAHVWKLKASSRTVCTPALFWMRYLNTQVKEHLFELTCPSEKNIEQRHTEKSNKYAHLTTDISDYNCKVEAFEVTLHLEITPHWPHCTSSSTQALNFHFSRRTFLHSH